MHQILAKHFTLYVCCKAVGHAVDGLNAKIHALVDSLENPVESMLYFGNGYDYIHGIGYYQRLR